MIEPAHPIRCHMRPAGTTAARSLRMGLCTILIAGWITACDGSDNQEPESTDASQPPAQDSVVESGESSEDSEARELLTGYDDALGESKILAPWNGDLDGLVERRHIRVLVAYSKTQYFLDGAVQRGTSYDALKIFEEWLNKDLGYKRTRVHVVLIPVPRNRIFQMLNDGMADMATANLTITPERLELVDFSDPFLSDGTEVVITAPGHPALESIDDLSGKTIHVRQSSSYWSSLETLNEDFSSRGLEAVNLVPADELLEDEDLIEMVNADLIPAIVVDDHKAELWKQIFDKIVVYPDIQVRTDSQIAWAIRKDAPKYREVVNRFVAENGKGSLNFNILTKRYLKSTKWINNALDTDARKRFDSVVQYFQTYAEEYGVDWVTLIAQGYQESALDQSARSHAGAIGVMQLLQSTASGKEVGIPDIQDVENNVHAGIKYVSWIRNTYFDDPAIDEDNRTFFALAAYNAGPSRINKMRKLAEERGLDPNLWFRNVERVVAEKVSREPVVYVGNIYKYYVAYKLSLAKQYMKQSLMEN